MDYLNLTPDQIPPIEGGFYYKPVRVRAVVDHTDPKILTVEYEGGAIATGQILTGEHLERFRAQQLKYSISQ